MEHLLMKYGKIYTCKEFFEINKSAITRGYFDFTTVISRVLFSVVEF